jgi:hypothetical protein
MRKIVLLALGILLALTLFFYPVPTMAQEGIGETEIWLQSPIEGAKRCGAPFGGNNPAGGQDFHNAIDLCGGNDEVLAAANGQIVWVSWWPPATELRGTGHGITVVIYHPEAGVYSYNAHLNGVAVQVGDQVLKGQVVGWQGTTGYMKVRNKHLHYGISIYGPEVTWCWDTSCWQNPDNYLGRARSGTLNPPPTQPSLAEVLWKLDTVGLAEVVWEVSKQEKTEIVPQFVQEEKQNEVGKGVNVTLAAILLFVFILGAVLLSSGRTWPLGLVLIVSVAIGILILLNSESKYETKIEEISFEPTEVVVIESQPRQMELPSDLIALLEQEVVFPNLPQAEGDCKVSQKFPEKILQWCDLITAYSTENGLDPDMVAALIWQESGGNPIAYSRSGAVGLMQVMPRDGIAASFICRNGPCFTNRPSIAELEDPEFNVRYGTGMIAGLLKSHGNLRDALKYYGPMDVGYYYADIVIGIYDNHKK